jgi:replicative DNA helicase
MGLKVLPVWSPYGRMCSCGKDDCPSPGKHPHEVLGPRGGLNLATSDEATIRAWWTAAPEASIGVALRASGLIAFDVDKPENYTALAAAEQRLGELPHTLIQISGSGNWHVIFKAPAHDIVGVFDGIVMRAKNFIVVAPSLHASGNCYAWKPGYGLGEAVPAELPPAWLEALKRPEVVGEVGIPAEATEPEWLRIIPHDERVRRMRAHLAQEPGESKGVSAPGTAFNVTRTCARGFAIRDADVLLRILLEDYDTKCQPPYGPERVRKRVQKVYDEATSPSWGANLMPDGERRKQSLVETLGEDAARAIEQERTNAAAVAEERGEALWIDDVGAREQPPTRFYTTGFPALDERMGGGLATRHVCGAVGGTAVGKSGFAGVIGLHVSEALPVLHVSTELPRDELFIRYASLVMGFEWRDGMRGKIPRADMRGALKGRRIKLLGTEELPAGQELQHVYIQAVKMATQHGVAPLVIVDYVQMLARCSDEKLRARVGDLTKHLRVMSQALDAPFLAILSTARGFYTPEMMTKIRAKNNPLAYLPAAKESGDVEYDCASLLFLDVDQNREGVPKPARIAVAKCRVGDVGFVGARFHGPTGRWVEDQSALPEMANSGDQGGREILDNAKDDSCLLDIVGECPNVCWRDVRDMFAKRAHRRPATADDTRARLLEAKRIESHWPMDEHGRTKPGNYYRLIAAVAPTPQPAPTTLDLSRYERKS